MRVIAIVNMVGSGTGLNGYPNPLGPGDFSRLCAAHSLHDPAENTGSMSSEYPIQRGPPLTRSRQVQLYNFRSVGVRCGGLPPEAYADGLALPIMIIQLFKYGIDVVIVPGSVSLTTPQPGPGSGNGPQLSSTDQPSTAILT